VFNIIVLEEKAGLLYIKIVQISGYLGNIKIKDAVNRR